MRAQFGAGTILSHCRVPFDAPRLGTAWYYPDFVFRDASGLCLDIGIDEPYVWASKAPPTASGKTTRVTPYFCASAGA